MSAAQRIRFLSYLKATRERYSAFVSAGCGLSPVLEAGDIDKLLRSLDRHGKLSQQQNLIIPIDCVNEIFSYLPVPNKHWYVEVDATVPPSKTVELEEEKVDDFENVSELASAIRAFVKDLGEEVETEKLNLPPAARKEPYDYTIAKTQHTCALFLFLTLENPSMKNPIRQVPVVGRRAKAHRKNKVLSGLLKAVEKQLKPL